MSKIEYTKEELKKLNALKQYFQSNGIQPTLIGMNDSQGVTVKSLFLKDSFFDELAAALSDETLSPIVMNAFSLLNNKTEHIDYLLESNPNLAELKYMRIHSYQEAIEKLFQQLYIPFPIPQIIKLATGGVIRLAIHPKKIDCKYKLSDTLKYAKQPIFIYSSGNNDLMRAYGNNPFSIKKDYQLRNITTNFDYTMLQAKKEEILDHTVHCIEENMKHILSINPNTNIYTISPYIPKSLRKEEMNIFQDIILNFNDRLKELCGKYQIHFIDTCEIGNKYNQSGNNFHVSYKGHHAIAMNVLDALYQDIILGKKVQSNDQKFTQFHYNPYGTILEVSKKTKNDQRWSLLNAKILKKLDIDTLAKILELTEYSKKQQKKLAQFHIKRQKIIADEHKRETRSLEKAYQKAKNKK